MQFKLGDSCMSCERVGSFEIIKLLMMMGIPNKKQTKQDVGHVVHMNLKGWEQDKSLADL